MYLFRCAFAQLSSDPVPRSGGIVGVPLLAAGGEPFDCGRAKGAKFAENGRDGTRGPIRQNVPLVQRAADRQEKDARQEKNAQSRIQRELRL